MIGLSAGNVWGPASAIDVGTFRSGRESYPPQCDSVPLARADARQLDGDEQVAKTRLTGGVDALTVRLRSLRQRPPQRETSVSAY